MSEVLSVSKKQRIIGNLTSLLVIIAAGAVLIASYLGMLGVELNKIALPVCLGCVGLIFVFQAVIQLNPVSMWLGWAFLVPAIISAVANFTTVGYGKLYPLYIATPAVCCFMAMVFGKGLTGLLKAAAVFLLAAVIFCLHAIVGIKIWIVLIVFFAYLLIIGVYVVVYLGRDNK